jgi:DNA-binding transcriptional ArsR family regulator
MIDGLMKRVYKMIDDVEAIDGALSNRLSREILRTLADAKRQRIAGPEIAKLQKIYDERGVKKEE